MLVFKFYPKPLLTIICILFSIHLQAQFENEVEVNIDSLFSNTHFTDINEALKSPDKVHSLDLSMQKLEELTDSIKLFTNLESLDISFNRFKKLPESITSLNKLKKLSVSGCYDLEALPENMQLLESLEEFRIEDMQALPNSEKQRAIRLIPWAKVYAY